MHGTCKYLGRRCRHFVDEHNEWYLLVRAVSVGTVFLLRRLVSLRVDNEFVLGKELVGNLNCRCQIASCVVAQVYNEIFEALL